MVNRNIFKTSKQIKKKKGKKNNNLELVFSITIEDSQSANHWLHTRNKKARLNFVREKSKTTCTVLKKKSLDKSNQDELTVCLNMQLNMHCNKSRT